MFTTIIIWLLRWLHSCYLFEWTLFCLHLLNLPDSLCYSTETLSCVILRSAGKESFHLILLHWWQLDSRQPWHHHSNIHWRDPELNSFLVELHSVGLNLHFRLSMHRLWTFHRNCLHYPTIKKLNLLEHKELVFFFHRAPTMENLWTMDDSSLPLAHWVLTYSLVSFGWVC